MKALRTAIQTKLRTALPTLSRIDRFNNQYRKMEDEQAVDYALGAVYVELNIGAWEQLAAQQIQEADCDIVLHVVRQYLGDTFEHTPLTVLDLPGSVYVALQGKTLSDGTGRDIANALVRTNSQEDNDHDGLEVDVITFRTRITDYLADTSVNWTTTAATLDVANDQNL